MTRPARARAAGALLGWTAFLVAAVVALRHLGGPLAPPPLSHPDALGAWLDRRQPAEAAFAVLRLATVAMAWYLLAVTVAGVAARAVGAVSVIRAVDAVTLPAVRRLVHAAVGASLLAATVGGGVPAMAQGAPTPDTAVTTSTTVPPPGDVPTMHALPDDPATGAPEADVPVMRRLPDAPAAPPDTVAAPPTTAPPESTPPSTDVPTTVLSTPESTAPPAATSPGSGDEPSAPAPPSTPSTSAPAASPPAAPPTTARPARPVAAPRPAPAPPPAGPSDRRIRPGDHFWAVAEDVLAQAWGRAPTDAEIDPYWRVVIDANRSLLADPGNPDLLFPGQVITVPAPPAPGGRPA
ncbi:MAG TPA: hypothetical protein VFJ85_14855 [Acidimicrobiales bacterium]|nr:hypothetical protein [Acidimicrobiales bacterium]